MSTYNQDILDPQFEDGTMDDTQDADLQAELQRKDEIIRNLTARAKKAEARARETKGVDPELSERLERQDIRIAGYSEDETDYIMKNGGKSALQDKFVMAAINSLREQKKAEDAMVTGDTAKSEIEKKVSKDQFAGMSGDEMEKFIRSNS